jgi:ribulose kinase
MLRASALTRLARSRTWEGEPINVTRGSQLGDLGERNIVLWADNLAEKEADLINATGSSVLDYVGGAISVRSPPRVSRPTPP